MKKVIFLLAIISLSIAGQTGARVTCNGSGICIDDLIPEWGWSSRPLREIITVDFCKDFCPDKPDPCTCPWRIRSIPIVAYQGYESPNCGSSGETKFTGTDLKCGDHLYEWEAVEEALKKYSDWSVEYIYWEGEQIDPNYMMKREGYIIIKKRDCQKGG
uniref:Uncharacterized protein n=1 Tax=viral metagenome TaxID=1070528 RepID=A0A6M3IM95_9ZZZZ